MSEVKDHFDVVAEDYDFWKRRNYYYYENLKSFFREYVPAKKQVFDFGCGTGDILAALNPEYGVGIDVSSGMIERARDKFQSDTRLYFTDNRSDQHIVGKQFQYVVCADVIEHLEDVDDGLRFMRSLVAPDGRVIVSMATALWEPVLMILEKLHMKMPEGPHNRITFRLLRAKAKKAGFHIEEEGTRILVPTHAIPGADWINKYFRRIPIVRSLGLVGYLVLRPR